MIGDGVRRYRSGANRQPPYSGLLHPEEVSVLSRAHDDLTVLSRALGRPGSRRDAAVAARAIGRLFARDRQERGGD